MGVEAYPGFDTWLTEFGMVQPMLPPHPSKSKSAARARAGDRP
jgi:hypothetical protein